MTLKNTAHRIIAGAVAGAVLLASMPAVALPPPPSMPRIATFRLDAFRAGEMPGVPRAGGSPKDQYMLAPAQPETAMPPKRKKRN